MRALDAATYEAWLSSWATAWDLPELPYRVRIVFDGIRGFHRRNPTSGPDPHAGHRSGSISKMRRSSRAQLVREGEGLRHPPQPRQEPLHRSHFYLYRFIAGPATIPATPHQGPKPDKAS